MTTIETPTPLTVTEKREALLYNMLSHATHFLKRFLKHQQRRNTPQSLEAAEYIKQELQMATAWLQEFKDDEIMRKAFATLADEIEAQIAQEVADVWDVWEWIQDYGGFLSRIKINRDCYEVLIALNSNDLKGQTAEYRDMENAAAAARIVRQFGVRKQGEP